MRRYLAASLVVMLSVWGLAACGGDDDSGGDQAAEQGDGADEGGTEGNGGDQGDTGDEGDGGDGGDEVSTGNEELDALLEKAKSAEVKVTYETSGDETLTISQKPPKSAIFSDGGVIIDDGSGSIIQCSDIDSDAPTCMELPLGGEFVSQMLTGFFGPFMAAVIAGAAESEGLFLGDGFDTSTEEIAGREALCSEFDASETAIPGAAGRIEVCMDSETGIMLRSISESDGASDEIVAVEVGEPDDSDFEPPVTPETIPGLTTDTTED